jgi:hypothetical protein
MMFPGTLVASAGAAIVAYTRTRRTAECEDRYWRAPSRAARCTTPVHRWTTTPWIESIHSVRWRASKKKDCEYHRANPSQRTHHDCFSRPTPCAARHRLGRNPRRDYIYQEGTSRSLPTFYMARHPVTNVRYQAFIDAGGYDDERWWQGIERTQPQESRWPQATRPCTSVNWYEAVAFSRWLSEQLGYTVRLPS